MDKRLFSSLVALCALILVTCLNGAALADRRVALVIGNSHYTIPSLVLSNPANDAEDVAAALRDLGFEVIYKTDLDKRGFETAMAQFARLATDADAALFYYAGHALQYQGRNYLMPTDAELEDEVSLRYQMMMIDDIRAALDRASGVKIMILDACRNSPVVDRLRKRIAGQSRSVENTRGLARIDKTQGMVVAFATAADDVAADGSGRNSPYTAALLKRLREPGLEIEIMFRRIAADVNAQTNGRQRPETYISLLNEYYLNQKDEILWNQIKDSEDPAAFRNFVDRFPSSTKSFDAQRRLNLLESTAREAARVHAEEEARARVSAAERERAEQQAARERQESERLRLAKIAQDQTMREAAERQVAERMQLAQQERERAEREARVRQEAERIRLAKIEQERADREAARQEVERKQLAMAEQESVEPPNAEQGQKAEATRRGLERQSGLQVVPTSIPQQQACQKDEEILARLRSNQSRDDVIRFEKELTCARLRPQVLRLRESLAIEPGEEQANVSQPAARVERQQQEQQKVTELDPAAQALTCQRDEERLEHLRESRVLGEVVRFEHELGCEKLRLQLIRLKESLGSQ
jgi:uncharacterized caspase-like protein